MNTPSKIKTEARKKSYERWKEKPNLIKDLSKKWGKSAKQITEKSDYKLRPCPFCGSDKIEKEAVSGVLYVRCQECSCAAGQVFTNDRKWRDVSDKWNTRITDPKPESICDTAPYPQCNGAEGCDTCENQQ